MRPDDDLETVADSLNGDILVAGLAGDLGAVADRAGTDDQPQVVGTGDAGEFEPAVRDVGLAVLAMAGQGHVTDSVLRAADEAAGFVVAVFDGHGDEGVDLSLLERVREAVDVTLLTCRKRPPEGSRSERQSDARARRAGSEVAVSGAVDFVRMVSEPGHINLDLADARTVLTNGSLAVLAGGTATLETDGSRRAVRRTFEEIPATIDAARGSNALVSVSGGPEMSIDDAIAAVRAVRDELGDVDDLIWGVATDESLADRVTVDIVFDDITYRPPLSAGDPCRRCGATLAVYTFGERTTLACEGCGFADLSVSLREGTERDSEM